MRIITQDEEFDIAYELCALFIEPSDRGYDGTRTWLVKAYTDCGGTYLLGRYDTEERALEVLKEIRKRCVMSENFKLSAGAERDELVNVMAEVKNVDKWSALEKFIYFYMPEK